ncbi:hypothetical protein [Priestia megaterium]|nr:hypothetical protein [Priestia megaterium]
MFNDVLMNLFNAVSSIINTIGEFDCTYLVREEAYYIAKRGTYELF